MRLTDDQIIRALEKGKTIKHKNMIVYMDKFGCIKQVDCEDLDLTMSELKSKDWEIMRGLTTKQAIKIKKYLHDEGYDYEYKFDVISDNSDYYDIIKLNMNYSIRIVYLDNIEIKFGAGYYDWQELSEDYAKIEKIVNKITEVIEDEVEDNRH